MHQHNMEPFTHPAANHHHVIAQAYHAPMPSHFHSLDIVHKYYRLSYLHKNL
jgi:hypothetical protein